jgi:predicted nucleic acid-binding protein
MAAENALADNVGWVPSHFGIEVILTLRRHERRKLIAPQIVDIGLVRLRDFSLKEDVGEMLDVLGTIVTLARRHTLRVADAAYLELAMRLGLPVATRDMSLARAANETGVPLFNA